MIRRWLQAMVRTRPSGQHSSMPAARRRPQVLLRLETVEDRTVASATTHEPPTLLADSIRVDSPATPAKDAGDVKPAKSDGQTDPTSQPTSDGPDVYTTHDGPVLLLGAQPADASFGLEAGMAAIPALPQRTASLDDRFDDGASTPSSASSSTSSHGDETPTVRGTDVGGLTSDEKTGSVTPNGQASPPANGPVVGTPAVLNRVPASLPVSGAARAAQPASQPTSTPPSSFEVPGAGRRETQVSRGTSAGASLPSNLSDGSLLQRFVVNREQAAFGALVQRYGGVVLGVCHKVLGDYHAAQDASQATFMVLARKAGMLDRSTPLGGWLYKVAYHLALRSRAVAARQKLGEKEAADELPAATADPGPATVDQREIQQVLQEELQRLPEKYRAPLT